MEKVLLIGDSIRMNYQPKVVREMKNKAQIFAIDENARFSAYTLWYIREWLETYGTPDIIHWNNGMWDIYRHDGETENFADIALYKKNIGKIYEMMSRVCDRIIFATITPVRTENTHCSVAEIREYNKAALGALDGKNVVINDLFSLVSGHEDEYICDDLMHLSQKGIEVCGKAVADNITRLLK